MRWILIPPMIFALWLVFFSPMVQFIPVLGFPLSIFVPPLVILGIFVSICCLYTFNILGFFGLGLP